MWKAQEELATRLCNELERELAEARSDWDRQLSELGEQHEAFVARHLGIDDKLQSSRSALTQLQRSTNLRATQAQSEATAFDAKIQEVDEALGATKRALQEKVSTLAAIRGGASTRQAQAREAQSELEKQLQKLGHDAEEARNRLLAEASTERQRAHRV